MQFKQKKYSNAIFFVSNHIIFSFIWIKTANLHFGILCRFFFFSFSLKALFLFGFKCLPKWFKSTHSNAIFCCYHYLFADRSDKNGFRRIMTVKFQFRKNKYPTKKRWLKWIQLTAVIIDNFINSWQNWFPQKILISADIDRRASCFLSICVFFLLLVEIRLINECGWRHTQKKRTKKKQRHQIFVYIKEVATKTNAQIDQS